MPDDVKHLDPETESLVPGIDISVVVGCGDTRQISLRTMLVASTPEAEANALLDKVFRIADRQRARYDLEKEEHEFDQVGTALTALIAGLPIAQRTYLQTVEKLKAEMKVCSEQYDKLHEEGYEEHTRTGRRGGYEPTGARKANMERAKVQGKKIAEEIDRQRTEAAQQLENSLKSIERYRKDLVARKEKVDGMRKVVGLGPISGFEDALSCKLPEGLEE